MAKKRAKRTAARKRKPIPPAIVEKAVTLRVSLHGDQRTLEALRDKLGLSPADAERALAEANKRLVQEAGADRVQAYGEAVTRYNECYVRSMAIADVKTALAAQNALTKLYGFTDGLDATTDQPTGHADRELADVRAHLEPLTLAPPETPTAELARLAALRVADTLHHGPTPRP